MKYLVVSILYEVPRVCNAAPGLSALGAGSFNPLRGSSSLQRKVLNCYKVQGRVSILYEVPRVCNVGHNVSVENKPKVSILYEVPRVCNVKVVSHCSPPVKFQSSTRFLEFATALGTDTNIDIQMFQSSTRFLEFATVGVENHWE